MSFLSEAKAELCMQKADKKQIAISECYGILLYCNTFLPASIRIITASSDFASFLPKLFHKAFSLDFDILPSLESAPAETRKKYIFSISNPDKLSVIFNAFGYDSNGVVTPHVNFAVLEGDGCAAAFIRGAFLAGGSVTDPEKALHLELATSHSSVSREVHSILLDLGLYPKESTRSGNTLLYFKQADMIADFFTTIGAPATGMKMIDASIVRSMRNKINRQINCDSANADKVVNASRDQINAIRYIKKQTGSLDILPEELSSTALLRVANPEASLSDLALLSIPKVTKSCLAYRLKRIVAISEALMAQAKDNSDILPGNTQDSRN